MPALTWSPYQLSQVEAAIVPADEEEENSWELLSDFPNDVGFRLDFRAGVWNKSYTKFLKSAFLTLHDLNLDLSKYKSADLFH